MDEFYVITRALQKALAVCSRFDKILVSISGGSDSDVMLDVLLKVCPKEKMTFVFFDTGIEYKATKEHLDDLEKKYGITILREKAKVPVPLGCYKYGVPFISKFVSQMIERLQKHNFDFANDGNKSFEELNAKYPKLKGALTWWCNNYPTREGKMSYFNINSLRYLKEFMIANPPDFRISAQCCDGAKKNPSHNFEKKFPFDLKCVGLRKAEGGIRTVAFKNCFDFDSKKSIQSFRPIWWFTNEDKDVYCDLYEVDHSKCYSQYGLTRTGCASCPFGSKFESELQVIKKYEPQLFLAVNNIFGKSYEYTRKYREFKKQYKVKEEK